MTRRALAALVRLVYRPIVDGADNVLPDGPVILASNHLSFIDSVMVTLLAPRPVVFLAKAEYFTGRGIKGRLTRSFFTACGAVPVHRGTHRAAQAALDAAHRVLAAGRAFGIYPEGTRSLDGRLYRGRTGVAWLALTTGAPVVPVALIGTDRLQPVGRRLPGVHRFTVRFGAPLRFTGTASSARDRRTVTDEIMLAIQGLSGQQAAGTYHPPP